MELFRTEDFYIFVKGEYSLWWDRITGAFIPKTGNVIIVNKHQLQLKFALQDGIWQMPTIRIVWEYAKE